MEACGYFHFTGSSTPLTAGMLNTVFETALAIENRSTPQRTGGYFVVADAASGLPFGLSLCGKVGEKAGKYFTVSQEKAMRLAQHPEHLTSWQTRDVEKLLYGGAIRCGKYILSFSGFSDAMDESLVLAVACLIGLLDENAALAMTRISENQKWPLLRDELCKILGLQHL